MCKIWKYLRERRLACNKVSNCKAMIHRLPLLALSDRRHTRVELRRVRTYTSRSARDVNAVAAITRVVRETLLKRKQHNKQTRDCGIGRSDTSADVPARQHGAPSYDSAYCLIPAKGVVWAAPWIVYRYFCALRWYRRADVVPSRRCMLSQSKIM